MTNKSRSFNLLRAKLHRPALPLDYVPRPRLLARLEQMAHQQLVALTAPAGYGKTTLVRAWVEQLHCPNAWLSLDAGDNDMPVFLAHFIAAIQSVLPGFGKQVDTFWQGSSLPPMVAMTAALVGALDEISKDFVLVLDDFHQLTNAEIHTLIDGLLHYPQPQFHLVLTSRHELPAPLSRLLAQGRMTEMRANDLRFSASEAASFIEQTLPAPTKPETIRILTEKTEGWAVGLRLATIAIRRWGVSDHQPAILQVDNPYIVDYLVNEVLVRCPVTVQRFLLQSSILDRLSTPLCAAMLGTESFSQSLLPGLEREGLFVESVDNHQEWYRFHQLFRDILRQRLEANFPAADVAALHLKASAWFTGHGFVEEAIDHALLGGDLAGAIDILTQESYRLVEEERWLFLESLLNKFEPEVINERATLLVLMAWICLARMQLSQVERIRIDLEMHANLDSLGPLAARFMKTSRHLFAAIKHNWSAGFEQAIAHSQAALTAALPEWGLMRGYAFIHLGTAAHSQQGRDAGLAILASDDSWMEPWFVEARRRIAISFVDWLAGDLSKLLQTTRQGLALTRDLRGYTTESLLHYFAGSVHYELNNLVSAAAHFEQVLQRQYNAHPQGFLLSAFGQALVYQAQGRADEAWQSAESAVNYCLEMSLDGLLYTARSFQAELALRQERFAFAGHWATQMDWDSLPTPMPFYYESNLTLPKILLAEGSQASLRRAETELERLSENVFAMHNVPGQIRVLALQAQLCTMLKDGRGAQELLTKAVGLAQPGGFVRVFVDQGAPMAEQLSHLVKQGFAGPYLQRILAAFPTALRKPANILLPALAEALTQREMDVLGLLAKRLSNKEIAAELVISPETVKRHTSNIYQKLGVKNRRQAVAGAFSLGLLAEGA